MQFEIGIYHANVNWENNKFFLFRFITFYFCYSSYLSSDVWLLRVILHGHSHCLPMLNYCRALSHKYSTTCHKAEHAITQICLLLQFSMLGRSLHKVQKKLKYSPRHQWDFYSQEMVILPLINSKTLLPCLLNKSPCVYKACVAHLVYFVHIYVQ